ncbi:MAG: hypothetical protein KF712_18385 [Akkermansiaceae bacterium]|nr:hypothetical protein [Akkermansiaceae bacterium]
MAGMNGEDQPLPATDPYLTPESPPEAETTRTYVTPGLFRLLLGLSLVLVVLQLSADLMTEHTLPPALRGYGAGNNNMPEGTQAIIAFGLLALAFLVCAASYVGMFMLRKWGRRCYVLSNVAGIAAVTLLPPYVLSSIADAIHGVSCIAIGKIIAVAYFTPLFDQAEAERMNMRSNRQPAT